MAIRRVVFPALFALLLTGCATTIINFEATDQALFSRALNNTISTFDMPASLLGNKKVNLRVVGFKSTNKELSTLRTEGTPSSVTWESILVEDKIIEYLRLVDVVLTESDKSDYELVVMNEVAGLHRAHYDFLIFGVSERAVKVKMHLYLFNKHTGKIEFSKNYAGDVSTGDN